jgi:hypothetical protein
MELALSRLPPGWTPLATRDVDVLFSFTGGVPRLRRARNYRILYEGVSLVVRTQDSDALADAFDSALHVALAERSTERLFVHAGVVGWQGRAIVLPGASLSGKTSLVAELLRAGALFYSDDRAVIDATGHVHPYPKPLSIRVSPLARQTPSSAASFGAETGTEPLPVGVIAFASYREGASWRPERLPSGQAMLAMLKHTAAVRTRPATAMRTLRRAIDGAVAYRGSRGEAAEAAQRILAIA